MNKYPADSKVVISEIMMPSQANTSGCVHGGEIMKLMDTAAYASARRYAHTSVVTARVDELEFHTSTAIGDLVICTAQVVFVGKTSMEVAVTVEIEDLECADSCNRRKALTAFFTMVSLNKDGKPNPVPELILNSDEDREAFEEGKKRYEYYKSKRNKDKI